MAFLIYLYIYRERERERERERFANRILELYMNVWNFMNQKQERELEIIEPNYFAYRPIKVFFFGPSPFME